MGCWSLLVSQGCRRQTVDPHGFTEDGRPLEVACVPLAAPPGLILLSEATLSPNPPSSILYPPFPLIPGFYTRVENFPLYSAHRSQNRCYLLERPHWRRKSTWLVPESPPMEAVPLEQALCKGLGYPLELRRVSLGAH